MPYSAVAVIWRDAGGASECRPGTLTPSLRACEKSNRATAGKSGISMGRFRTGLDHIDPFVGSIERVEPR